MLMRWVRMGIFVPRLVDTGVILLDVSVVLLCTHGVHHESRSNRRRNLLVHMIAIDIGEWEVFGRPMLRTRAVPVPRLAPPWRDVALSRCSLHVEVKIEALKDAEVIMVRVRSSSDVFDFKFDQRMMDAIASDSQDCMDRLRVASSLV